MLRRAGAGDAKCLIATTSSDKVNLLVCQVARASFGPDNRKMRLVARANNSSNMAAFEAAGIETMSPARAAATILENMVLRPSLLRLLAAGGEPEHVAEVTVEREGGAGKTLAELALRGCVVAALKRDERLVVPNGSTRQREGDVLTLIGGESAVHSAREKLDGTS